MEEFPKDLLLSSVLAGLGASKSSTTSDDCLTKLRRSLEDCELELHKLTDSSASNQRNLHISVALSFDSERRAAFNAGDQHIRNDIASSVLQEIEYGSFKYQDLFEEGVVVAHEKNSERAEELQVERENLRSSIDQAEAQKLRDLEACIPTALKKAMSTASSKSSGVFGRMTCGTDGLHMPEESAHNIWASAWVECPVQISHANHGVDLLFVIDLSGSMHRVMSRLQQALLRITDLLRPCDRFSAVAFNHKASVLAEWTQVTDEGREQLRSIFKTISCGGGTNFCPVLDLIFQQSSMRTSKTTPMHVVFFSDGASDEPHATVCSRLSSGFGASGIAFALCSISFSDKSDPGLMCSLAQIGRGPYLHVAEEDALPEGMGRVWAWASQCCAEAFLIVRSLSNAVRLLEVEGAYGTVDLEDKLKCKVVALGPLLRGQRRAAAMRLAIAPNTSHADINAPLLCCSFVLSGEGMNSVQSCTLQGLQIPSLLVEHMTGVPLRVHLQEDFASFDNVKRCEVLKTLQDSFHLPSGCLIPTALRSGSVILECQVRLPQTSAKRFLESFDSAKVAEDLGRNGFSVLSVTVPGQITARRHLEWAFAKALFNTLASEDSDTTSGIDVQDLAERRLASIDPWGARTVLHDLALVQSLARNRISNLHRLWEAHAAHAWAFPSDGSLASLQAYDKAGQIAACAADMALAGNPVAAARPRLSAPQKLKLAWAGYEVLMVEFEGTGSTWRGNPVVHRIVAVKAYAAEEKEAAEETFEITVNVAGSAGRLQAEIAGLQPACGYFVYVSAISANEESSPCTPQLMCTLPPQAQWVSAEFEGPEHSPALILQWTGLRFGIQWALTMTPEPLFQKCKGFSLAKTVETENSRCRFGGLDQDVYRIDLDDARSTIPQRPPKKPVVPSKKRARAWACVGKWELNNVQQGLQKKYSVPIQQFCPGILVEVTEETVAEEWTLQLPEVPSINNSSK